MAKLYLEVYERHKAAFLNDSFDFYGYFDDVGGKSGLKDKLLDGFTYEYIWDEFFERSSITSQILSELGGKYLTVSAERHMKKMFKNLFEVIDKTSDNQK
jgi:hypothetical protein